MSNSDFSNKISEIYNSALSKRIEYNNLRTLSQEKYNIDFRLNHYLGTDWLPDFDFKRKDIIGSGGSRLLIDNSENLKIESFFASEFGYSQSLVTPTGYLANISLFSIFQREHAIIFDEYIHASIIDGIRMSFAHKYSFSHNDMDDLESKVSTLLKKYKSVIVVSEGLYSMEGTYLNIDALVEIKKKYLDRVSLIIDEAHSFGVLGKGIVFENNYQKYFTAITITFSKAIPYIGGLILLDKSIKEQIINLSRPFIFSTSMPIYQLHLLKDIYSKFIENKFFLIQKLYKNIEYLKSEVSERKIKHLQIYNQSPIITYCPPLSEKMLIDKVINKAKENKIGLQKIKYPTVSVEQERIRICIRNNHSFEDLDLLLKLFSE